MVPRARDFSRAGTPAFTQQRSWSDRRRKRVVVLALVVLLLMELFSAAFALTLSPWRNLRAANWRRTTPVRAPLLHVGQSQRIVTLASGVTETSETLLTLEGVQEISLLRVDLSNPRVHLGVVQAHNQLFGHGEKLSSMAQRSGALAGINSDFFEARQANDPLGMLEINGQLWQSPGVYAALGVTASGHLTMGRESFSGSVTSGGESYPLSSVNRYGDKGANHLRLYTPTLGTALPLHQATLVLLQPVAGSSTTFTVASMHTQATSLPLLRDQDALVGRGDAETWLISHLQPGASIEISEHLAPDDNLVQAVGGGPVLLKDGAPYHDPHVPAPNAVNVFNPLTAVGMSKDGRYALFVVCNGRGADVHHSRGFTYAGMASYLLAHDAYQAMIFDSGGSSELVARLPGQNNVSVINAPSAGQERLVADGLFVYSGPPQAG